MDCAAVYNWKEEFYTLRTTDFIDSSTMRYWNWKSSPGLAIKSEIELLIRNIKDEMAYLKRNMATPRREYTPEATDITQQYFASYVSELEKTETRLDKILELQTRYFKNPCEFKFDEFDKSRYVTNEARTSGFNINIKITPVKSIL